MSLTTFQANSHERCAELARQVILYGEGRGGEGGRLQQL